jgi:hypothetical protein
MPGLVHDLLTAPESAKDRTRKPMVTALAALGRIAARHYL